MRPFEGDKEDNELELLATYLHILSSHEDMRADPAPLRLGEHCIDCPAYLLNYRGIRVEVIGQRYERPGQRPTAAALPARINHR